MRSLTNFNFHNKGIEKFMTFWLIIFPMIEIRSLWNEKQTNKLKLSKICTWNIAWIFSHLFIRSYFYCIVQLSHYCKFERITTRSMLYNKFFPLYKADSSFICIFLILKHSSTHGDRIIFIPGCEAVQGVFKRRAISRLQIGR